MVKQFVAKSFLLLHRNDEHPLKDDLLKKFFYYFIVFADNN